MTDRHARKDNRLKRILKVEEVAVDFSCFGQFWDTKTLPLAKPLIICPSISLQVRWCECQALIK